MHQHEVLQYLVERGWSKYFQVRTEYTKGMDRIEMFPKNIYSGLHKDGYYSTVLLLDHTIYTSGEPDHLQSYYPHYV